MNDLPSGVETHLKLVRGKLVLVPSLALLQSALPAGAAPVDPKALRARLLEHSEAALVCPVTVRRHLKALGRVVAKVPA
jgi:hypothetical protein